MEKFFALYLTPVGEMEKMMANAKPADMQKGMAEWQKWMDSLGESMVEMGAPLGKTKRVTADGVSDVKNEVGGYSIVQAASHEAAADLMKGSPHFHIPGAYIDVLKIVEM
jgi:hypothetical protein